MNFKKINFIFLITLLVTSFMFSNFALADNHTHIDNALRGVDTTAGAAEISPLAGDATTGLTTLIGLAINLLFGAVTVVFLTIILIGGYIWMTSRGNQEQIDRAKKFIINGIFGMVVIFLSYALVTVVLFFLSNATNA